MPCVLVTALGSRCHLEGPVTATVLTVRSWTVPGPEEALQPPTEGYTSSLANLAVGVQRRGLPGEPGKDRKDPAGPSLVQLPCLMGFRGGEGWALFLSATRWQQWAGQVPALRGSRRNAQHAEVSPAAL